MIKHLLAALTISVVISGAYASETNGTSKVTSLERINSDISRMEAISRSLRTMSIEMNRIHRTSIRKKKDYTSDLQDKVENMLFRYLVCRDSLYDLVNYYNSPERVYASEDERLLGFLLSFDAAIHLSYYSSYIVAAFIDDKVVIDKLNEPYHRSGIPSGTYDTLFKNVTSIDNIQSLRAAWELYCRQADNTESRLTQLADRQKDYAKLSDEITDMYQDVDIRVKYILEKKSLILPDVANRLRQNEIANIMEAAVKKFGSDLYAAQGTLFTSVSRVQSPVSSNIRFSDAVIRQMRELMQPGDLVFTFSSGYMSNIFLPGKFKHGLVYVGTPEQRAKSGLSADMVKDLPEARISKFKADIATAALPNGKPADLIEAVSEGVIFNSLDQMTHDHVARIAVLRPRISNDLTARQLSTVFLLLGCGYDFNFDFVDGTYQCCTEVIYRALHNVGNIKFDLVKRGAVQTVCADDMLKSFLASSGKDDRLFDFVLIARNDPNSKENDAILFTGKLGELHLENIMKASDLPAFKVALPDLTRK